MVSISPRVDLTENAKVDWFCILPPFRLVTLANVIVWFNAYEAMPHC